MPETLVKNLNFVNDASETIYRARLWINSNPRKWRRLVELAMHEAEQERHFSIRGLMERIRSDRAFMRAETEPFKINNSLSAAFARILISEHPEVRPYIETRRSKCDGML